jgi:hypothetical protein
MRQRHPGDCSKGASAFLQMLADDPAALAGMSPTKLLEFSIRASRVLPRIHQGECEATVGGDWRFDKFNSKGEAADQLVGAVFSLDTGRGCGYRTESGRKYFHRS